MSISSPTMSFPVDEVNQRIQFLKAHAGKISNLAVSIQSEFRSMSFGTDSEEKNYIKEADSRVGKELVALLQKAFPKDTILCEDLEPVREDSDFQWVLDPIDGSMNYVRGIPLYASSFGLEHRQTPVAGVVIVPPQDAVYSAILGQGAFKNGVQIRTSTIDALNRAIFSPNLPTKRANMIQEIMADLSAFLTYARSFRRTGSFVLDCCWISEGIMDAIWEKSIKHWDISASSVILAEAGGKMTDLTGKHYLTGLPELVASNGYLHDEILTLLRNVRSTMSRN